MEKHLIGYTGSESSPRSIYRNPDEELRNEIAGFEFQVDEIEFRGEIWTLKKEGDEYRCENGRDVKYLLAEEVEEKLESRREILRNKKFLAWEHFNRLFGKLYKIDLGTKGQPWKYSHLHLKQSLQYPNQELNPLDGGAYGFFYRVEFSDYYKISLKFRKSYEFLFLHFSPEGDFVNRDYNENFNEWTQDYIPGDGIFEVFKSNILEKISSSPLEYSQEKDLYFNDEYCFSFFNTAEEFGIYLRYSRGPGRGYQTHRGETVYKKPKKVDLVTPELVWERILNSITPEKKEILNLSENFSK